MVGKPYDNNLINDYCGRAYKTYRIRIVHGRLEIICGNKKTFEGVYKDNLSTNVIKASEKGEAAHAALARAVSSA